MKNPYEDSVKKQKELLDANPETPNLAKLAFYCGCDVKDLVEELRKTIEKGN